MLENHGFADVFNNVHTINPKEFVHIFKQRVIDTFKQEWFGTLEKSSVLEIYMLFKQTLEYELHIVFFKTSSFLGYQTILVCRCQSHVV